MNRWFISLPIHWKLIALAIVVSTCALLAATGGLLAFDIARFRTQAHDEAQALAQVLAENSAAAIVFEDAAAARQILASVRVRPVISLACVYRADGGLMADYRRSPAAVCPTVPADERGWRVVGNVVPVMRNDRQVGSVFVERTLEDLGTRVTVTASAGALMLVLAGALTFGLAYRLLRAISRPIVELAEAARAIERGEQHDMRSIAAHPDETGALVRAFSDMVDRLLSTNEALRVEVEQRSQMQIERERILSRERATSRLKDEFLAAVSHELRTPLDAILGWTHILVQTKQTDPTVEKAIAALSRNAHAQQQVIEDLLDISRIITGTLPLALQVVDMRSVVESAVEVVAPAATAKKIRLDVRLPASPCVVHADYDRLRQVVWNLLSNAVKFTPAGGAVTVSIVSHRETYGLTVSDTGAGIPPQFLEHVFERFRQADGSTTRLHGGLGLGLAIAKELTELHGGTIEAASAGLGQGAMFTVTLPKLRELQPTPAPGAAPKAIEPPNALERVSVLVVDDNQDALEILTATLGGAGAVVRAVSSGALALEELQRAPADVVLCDLAMPEMDGFEVLRRVRQIDDAASRFTLVFAISAYDSEEYRRRSFEAGFSGHIAKPFDVQELVRTMAIAMRVRV